MRIYRCLLKSSWPVLLCMASLLFLSVGVWEGIAWHRFVTTPLASSSPTTFIVTPNASLKQLAKDLHERGFISHPQFFVLMARQHGDASKLRMGEYAIDSEMTAEKLLNNMVAGKVVMRKLTFVEGTTMSQIRQLLLNNDALQHVAVKQTDQEMMASLGHPEQSSEGRFFPDTYLYTWGNKDTVILQQAYQRMANFLAQEWPQRADNLPYQTPDEALIVASLVESEAKDPAERPMIAGVIIRRLKIGMNLQIDPTVIYGVGKSYGSTITLEDLRSDNPYNTYRHKGLPPSPINMPSAASISAALHPDSGDALYYVAQGNGSHRFSATYPEHLDAVQKYRQVKESEADEQKWFGLTLFIMRSTGLY